MATYNYYLAQLYHLVMSPRSNKYIIRILHALQKKETIMNPIFVECFQGTKTS